MKTIIKKITFIAFALLSIQCSKDDNSPVIADPDPPEQEVNLAPTEPVDPVPANNSGIEEFTNVELSWTSSDPNEDKLTFDLYFGQNIAQLELIAEDISTSNFTLDLIDTGESFLWKVVAKDDKGLSTESKVFFFNTLENVLTENAVLTTQQEVNDFGAMGYTKIDGTLIIDHATISDLTPLSRLNKVSESLEIRNTGLTNLNGLNQITQISGNLAIVENPDLKDLEGLENLRVLVGELTLESNLLLTDIKALSAISKIESLSIQDNPSLQALEGLESLTAIAFDMDIERNFTLQDLKGLTALKLVGDRI